nr:tetratricopeptide repeat protein [Clostridium aestuarii]
MDRSGKLYLKALSKYQNGYIDKAINLCEESISLNINNKASINLKGLLYYLKGDLESAKALWKLNYQVNGDQVSNEYLQGLKDDEKRLSSYMSAIVLIKDMDIKNALGILKECKESDYNCINVDNAIAACYIKLGQYDNAIKYINNVLKLDSKNEIAIENKRELIKYGTDRKNFESNSFATTQKVISVVCVLLICFSVSKFGVEKIKLNKENIVQKNVLVNNHKGENENKESQDKNIKNKNMQNKDIVYDEANNKIDVKANNKNKEKFPLDAIKKSLDQKDYEKLYQYVSKWKDKEVGINERSIIEQGVNLLNTEGVKHFYTRGSEYLLNNKDYDKSIHDLLKAYQFADESYLYQHITYMLGVCYQAKNDVKSSLEYFIQYDNKFPAGNYEDEVLYRIAMINKDININEAKKYSKKLLDNYPYSQYSNSVIKSIINE